MKRSTKPLPPLTSDEAARQSRDFQEGWEAFTGRRMAEDNPTDAVEWAQNHLLEAMRAQLETPTVFNQRNVSYWYGMYKQMIGLYKEKKKP